MMEVDSPTLAQLRLRASEQEAEVLKYREYLVAAEAALARTRATVARFAPVYQVPNEILSTIFAIGHNDQCDPSRPAGTWSFSLRNAVCLTSRRFRDVAVNTGPMWTSFRIRLYHSECGDAARHRECMARALPRSKAYPLNFYFQCRCICTSCGPSSLTIKRAVTPIMSEMHRVRSLELDVCEFHPQIVWFLNQMRHDFAPLLEFFRCNFHGDSNPDLEYWLKSAGTCHLFRGGAPLLHSLSISGTQSSPRLLPPRGGVTSCTIADLQWADAHDKIVPLLTSMPLLTTLTLNNVRTIPDEPFGFPVLLLPSLKSLSMTGYAAFWFCGVLVSPLLESLTIIHSSNYTMDDLLRNIRNTRKFPLLRSLAIQLDVDALVSDGPTEARVFPSLDAEFMKSTSLLTHLRLDSTEESIRLVIRSMMNPHQAEQGPESVLWPHLQSVDFMNCLKSEALDFLSYRNKMGHSLADFSFRGVTIRPAGGDIAEMRRLLQAWDESYEYYE